MRKQKQKLIDEGYSETPTPENFDEPELEELVIRQRGDTQRDDELEQDELERNQ